MNVKLKFLTYATSLSLSAGAIAAQVEVSEGDYFDDFYGGEEMVEIATGVKTQIYKAPAIASVYSADDIKRLGATDIDDVLETVPGLHISRNSVNYNPIYIFRGVNTSHNSQVLMLINGIPITNNFLGDRNQVWGGMPVEAIARIEVIRGPGSSVYGADAFAGVINVITKNASDIKKNEVAVRLGQNATQDAWISYGHSEEDFSYSGVLEYHKTDGFDKTIEQDAQTLLDSIYGTEVSNAPGKLNLATENIDFRGELNYADVTVRAGYQLRNNVGTGAGLAESLDPDAKQKSERFNLDVNYVRNISDDFQIRAQGSYFDTYQKIKNNYLIYPKGAYGVYTEGLIGNPEHWERQTRASLSTLYSGYEKHSLRFDIGFSYSDLYKTKETKNFGLGPNGEVIEPGSGLVDVSDTPYIYLQETDRTNKYFFVQDIWSIANDWELTAGVRYDDYSDFGDTTNPRLALVWSSTLNLSTKLLYGQAFRAPSYAETGNQNNPTTLGNSELKPETMETTELAFDYHPSTGLAAVLSFYYYEWDDIIQFVPDEGDSTSTAQNFGKQIAYGTEFEFKWTLNDSLRLSGNYAYNNATNKNTESDTAFVPKQKIHMQADWNVSEDLAVNVKGNYVIGRERSVADSRENIDDYWISDVSLRWTPHNSSTEVALIAKNIFDEDAREPSINNGAEVNLPNDLPLAGRYLSLELRYGF